MGNMNLFFSVYLSFTVGVSITRFMIKLTNFSSVIYEYMTILNFCLRYNSIVNLYEIYTGLIFIKLSHDITN